MAENVIFERCRIPPNFVTLQNLNATYVQGRKAHK
jgi:hypothetical protein